MMHPETNQHQRVLTQYSESGGAEFYRWVMGDGGCDIHYGIYPGSATMQEATRASTMRLLAIARQALGTGRLKHVIDLGAGRGGPAHLIAQTAGAEVTCVDLCEHHHQDNLTAAAKLGLESKIHTLTGQFEHLPNEFSARFDLVWSQEAICHAENKRQVFNEVYRILRPGGVFAFSDILLSETATPEQSKAFTDVNAVTQLSTMTEYMNDLQQAGFEHVGFADWTEFLADNFANMLQMIKQHYDQLLQQGVPQTHLDTFAAALNQRLTWPTGTVMRWGAFHCQKTQIFH